MVLADTSRSRFYLQSLIYCNMIPSSIVLLKDEDRKNMPGQIKKEDIGHESLHNIKSLWNDFNFNVWEKVDESALRENIPCTIIDTSNIHKEEVIKTIKDKSESTFIYSGFGGVILKKKLFDTGKKFLHVHGGFLPKYKGSTTNYYSLIEDNSMGASAIILNEKIDSGPLIYRKTFLPPKDRKNIDHIYDSAVRSIVLIKTIKLYLKNRDFTFKKTESDEGELYFIIHPVLKHIAILAKD